MSKRLDDFIDNNRDAFDDEMPSVKVWENIETIVCKTNPKQNKIVPFIKWSIGAAALLLLSFSVYWLINKNKKVTPEIVASSNNNTDTVSIVDAPELNQFTQMINVKQEELKVMAKEQPELYQRFAKDITQLDSSYLILKKQWGLTPNTEVLVEAMIQNLQLQLNVLNQQLNIIQQIKQSKKKSHEKNEQVI